MIIRPHVEVMSLVMAGCPLRYYSGTCAFIPNPLAFRNCAQTGMDAPVYDYVMKQPETQAFTSFHMPLEVLPNRLQEGKATSHHCHWLYWR